MKGTFITFEGIEGSGKSTQIALLADFLAAAGTPATVTREPGGTLIGDKIRGILLDPEHKALDPTAELLLYGASRAQHLKEVILPALRAGRVVLCDRFSDATLAYQGYGRGLDREAIRVLDGIVTAGLRPDRTVLLDLDATQGLARATSRNARSGLESEARFENEAAAFHERVRQGYLALAREEPKRFRLVDASLAPEQVQQQVRLAVADVIGR